MLQIEAEAWLLRQLPYGKHHSNMIRSVVEKKVPLQLSLLLVLITARLGLAELSNSTSADKNCSGDDCAKSFTPPPADAMSRLMPTNQAVLSNDTKDQSASNVDIVTTPDTGSLGLGSFSKFTDQSDHQAFNPSPFLGVISETHINTYPQGMAVGEVFPDTVGNPHQSGHKYQYSIAGQRAQHTGHSYHDQVSRQRPTPVTSVETGDAVVRSTAGTDTIKFKAVDSTFPSLTYSSSFSSDNSFPSLTSSTKSLGGYPVFELPDRFKDFKDVSNSITDYRTPHPPIAFPGLVKPIREDLYDSSVTPGFDDRPDAFSGGVGGPGFPSGPEAYGPHPNLAGTDPIGAGIGAGLPPPPSFTSPPAIFPYDKKIGHYKGGKWKGFFKAMASLIPLGILVAAFTPNLLVVNATEDSESQPQVAASSQQPHAQSTTGGAEWTKIQTWNPTSTSKTIYRSLDEQPLLTSPAADSRSLDEPGRTGNGPTQSIGLLMTQCQKKKVCEALAGVDGSYKDYVDTLIRRVGGGLKEAAGIAADNKCQEINCIL